MECLASEHRPMPAACKEDMVINHPDWPAFVFCYFGVCFFFNLNTLRTNGITLHVFLWLILAFEWLCF